MSDQLAEWRDIPGYEGHYQASSEGQIKSLARSYTNRMGQIQPIRERILRPGNGESYRYLSLVLRATDGKSRRTWKVHQLVARAFHGLPPFDGAEICHTDGDPLNNRAENLRWDTRSANGLDSVLHGSNIHAKKTHCAAGHPFSPDNTTYHGPRGTRRKCVTCMRQYRRNYEIRVRGVA